MSIWDKEQYEGSGHQFRREVNIKEKEDFPNGILVLDGEIDDRLACKLIMQILYFKDTCPQRPITLYINSDGGSLTAGMAIYDTICFVPNEVRTIAVEKVGGIAALILAAGTKGRRLVCSDTQITFGQLYSTPYVQLSKEIYTTIEKVCEALAKHTGRMITEVRDAIIEEVVFNAQEAMSFGIVDQEVGL